MQASGLPREITRRCTTVNVQSFLPGKALLVFTSTLIAFARFSRASSVRGGSPAFTIDLKTAYASVFEPAFRKVNSSLTQTYTITLFLVEKRKNRRYR